MNLFYIEPRQVNETHFLLTGQEAHHASKVLRLKEGSKIHATNGVGTIFEGVIATISKREVTVEILNRKDFEEPRALVLGMGILKKRTRLEFAIEKAVELGASGIVLFQSQHSERGQFKPGRLEMIIMSAMKQSLRAWLPKLEVYQSLEDAVDAYEGFNLVIAHEKAGGEHASFDKNSSESLLLIGPEGGFSEREVKYVMNEGGTMVSLGAHRLRAETAAIVLLGKAVL